MIDGAIYEYIHRRVQLSHKQAVRIRSTVFRHCLTLSATNVGEETPESRLVDKQYTWSKFGRKCCK